MTSGILLRPAVKSDVGRLQAISAEARDRYPAIPALAHVANSPALDKTRFEPCRIIVATDARNGSIVGFAMTRPLDDLLYLDNISVASGQSGRGIGSELLRETVSYATALQAPAVTLTTFQAPPWNGPWFRRHGFQMMPPHHIGPGLAEVMARQALTLNPLTRETLWLPL